MKRHYKEWKPSDDSLALVHTGNNIIDEYEAAGYTLTLRQLYYQFVARDIIENTERSYKNCVLIHLGDHDPSGIDMTRDNADRLDLFTGCLSGDGVDVRRIALNMDQVHEYNPPTNPAKITDSRAKEYIKRYGRKSWELDALEPAVLEKLITDEVEGFIDRYMWDAVEDLETEAEGTLRAIHDNWDAVSKVLDK